MKRFLRKISLLSFIFGSALLNTVFAQNFSSAEAGGFKRTDSAQLKELISQGIVLRRAGPGQNDDLIFKEGGEFVVSGYTRFFEEKGKWRLDGEFLCMERPSSKVCRLLYLNQEKFRLVSDKGEVRGEGFIKK